MLWVSKLGGLPTWCSLWVSKYRVQISCSLWVSEHPGRPHTVLWVSKRGGPSLWVSRHLTLWVSRHRALWVSRHRALIVGVQTSRGCPNIALLWVSKHRGCPKMVCGCPHMVCVAGPLPVGGRLCVPARGQCCAGPRMMTSGRVGPGCHPRIKVVGVPIECWVSRRDLSVVGVLIRRRSVLRVSAHHGVALWVSAHDEQGEGRPWVPPEDQHYGPPDIIVGAPRYLPKSSCRGCAHIMAEQVEAALFGRRAGEESTPPASGATFVHATRRLGRCGPSRPFGFRGSRARPTTLSWPCTGLPPQAE